MEFTIDIDCELGKKYYRTDYNHVAQKQHIYVPVAIHPGTIICNHFIGGIKETTTLNNETVDYNTHFSPSDWIKQTAPIYWKE